MKYSILMPYYRKSMLHNTLVSFLHHYRGREDYEVIILEDHKNISEKNEHDALLNIVSSFSPHIKICHIETSFKDCWAPSRMFNAGAKNANGDFLVLTNPECFHLTNVLAGFDLEISKNPDVYIIAACLNASCSGIVNKFEDFKYEPKNWYQHSKHNNRKLHFCSMISKKLYNKIGGFDEGYDRGYGREDVDFLRTIIAKKIVVLANDNIMVIHMKHQKWPDQKRLWKINKQYYRNKWRGASSQ